MSLALSHLLFRRLRSAAGSEAPPSDGGVVPKTPAQHPYAHEMFWPQPKTFTPLWIPPSRLKLRFRSLWVRGRQS